MATRKVLRDQDFERFFNEIIKGIDAKESTEWEEKSSKISEAIRAALAQQMVELKNSCNDRFLDYCNTVKSLLAIYNFGNIETDEEQEDEGENLVRRDKALILEGLLNIVKHVEEIGYDLTPYVSEADSRSIFAPNGGKVMPLTMSVTTVLTTLIYFRRAFKRENLFRENEVIVDGVNLMDKAVKLVAEILVMIVNYIETAKFTGWGFTFESRAATLNDTYSVVDALGRFEDAFEKDDEMKRDAEFTTKVETYAREELGQVTIIDRAFSSVYKTAFNVYDRTKKEYGHNIFYSDAAREGEKVKYVYTKTDYEQIASSNRSSALFNPLYVAMITMYGYNEKEIVIRRFMDDYDLAREYYNEFEEELSKKPQKMRKPTLSEYAAEMDELKRHNIDFKVAVQDLLVKHPLKSSDYSDNKKWRDWYRLARVFQKYLETQEPERLMKIAEYRDYLNGTKDAIDQVQIMYRNFDNNQRLGIVDTDYVMFSSLDINTDLVNISKLNKANIAVNNLRPLLLSSKIMIVNALTRYPQADIEDLFNAILEARYQSNSNDDSFEELLWNADGVDMNSTARHCESITYDYFDYYERYELGLKAINGLKSNIGSSVANAIDEKTGSLSVEKAMQSDDRLLSFKRIVLDITRQNVDLIKTVYKGRTDTLEKRVSDLEAEKEELIAKHEKAMREQREILLEQHRKDIAKLEESKRIGDTLRRWIREETGRYLTETLSQIVLNKLNGAYTVDSTQERATYQIEKLLGWNEGEFIDANIPAIRAYGEKLRADVSGEDAANAKAQYAQTFKESLGLQELFEAAFNGVFDINEVTSIRHYDDRVPTAQKNEDISAKYIQRLEAHKNGQEYAPYTPPQTTPQKNKENH